MGKRQLSKMLSPHFFRWEFACQCCDRVGPYPKNLTRLVAHSERLRELANLPVNVHCGYRCPPHNAAVGGVSGSYHTLSLAVDFSIDGLSLESMASLARQAGFTGIGIYRGQGFIHADLGMMREWEE